MTPSSSDRVRTVSPLDIFGMVQHPPLPVEQSSQAFEAVLNKVTPPGKAALHRQPAKPTSTDRQANEPRSNEDNTSDIPTAAARRKQQAKTAPSSGPPQKSTDQEPADESRGDLTTGPPASTSPQSPVRPQEMQEYQYDPSEAEAQVDPVKEKSLSDQGVIVPPMVAIACPIVVAPLPSELSAESQPLGVAVTSVEGSPQGKQAELSPIQSGPAGDVAIPPSELEVTEQGNGPLSLAEPGKPSPETDEQTIVIDGQVVAEKIQPVEPGGSRDDTTGDSKDNVESPPTPEDAASPALPSANVLASRETQTAAAVAAPPPTTSPAVSSNDALQSQQSNSQPTTGVHPSPNRLPQHVLARSEAHPGHNPAPVPVDSARFLSRVAKAFQSAQQRDGEVRLRLSPPELGSLRLQVSVQDGVMVARMETETEAARSSLVSNLPALRERLAEQGVRIERFDIDLMQRPPSGTPDRPSDPQQRHDPEPLRLMRTPSIVAEAPQPTATIHNWNGQGRLNVIV